jgi:hypothetical protein
MFMIFFRRIHQSNEVGYIIIFVGKLMEEKSLLCLNLPPACEYKKCVQVESSNFLIVT